MPPQRRAFLEEMVRQIAAGADVVCLQEVPVWALKRLEEWSCMRAVGAVARGPLLGSAELGRWITELHHGLLRSAFTGEADAILVARGLTIGGERRTVVGERPLRRIAHVVRLDHRIDVVNFHTNANPAELERAAELARAHEAILAGDANVQAASVAGFSAPLDASIDQILVRGLELVRGPVPLPHAVDGVVVSDHAPLEVVVE